MFVQVAGCLIGLCVICFGGARLLVKPGYREWRRVRAQNGRTTDYQTFRMSFWSVRIQGFLLVFVGLALVVLSLSI
jgi:hypothetical protein